MELAGQGINLSPRPHSRPGVRFRILYLLEYLDSHSETSDILVYNLGLCLFSNITKIENGDGEEKLAQEI
jgi:hypothetical protein